LRKAEAIEGVRDLIKKQQARLFFLRPPTQHFIRVLAELAKLLDAADRFVFTVGRLCRRRADTGDSKFYRLAGQLFRQELTLADATKQVDERADRHFSLDTAIAETHELFRHDGAGFYGWEGLRYFLFEYEQRLKAVTKMQTSKLDWRDLNTSKKDHVTIEHIYPETPVSGDWPTFDLRRKRERDMLRNSLGNPLALSQSRNSKFSNRGFAEKRQGTDGTQGYFNGSYSEIQVSQYASWTPEAVLERGLEMLGFLEERWKVTLGSRADKIKLLNLEFLEPAGGEVQAESYA
jgi:hypothetical protein